MSKKSPKKFSPKQLKIIDVAMEIFAQKGYNGTTVRDIAQASNVNLAMINYYFGSKLQLLETIFEYMSKVSKNYFGDIILDTDLGPFEKLDLIIENYIKFSLENNNFIVILIRNQFNPQNKVIDEMIFMLKSRYWKIFQASLQEAQKSGDFNKNADVTTISSIIMGTLNNLISDQNFISRANNLNIDKNQEAYELLIIKCMESVKSMIHTYLMK